MKVRKMNRITAADDSGNSALVDLMDQLEDDFDYVIAGLEKLDRTSAAASKDGQVIAEELSEAIQSAISQISDIL